MASTLSFHSAATAFGRASTVSGSTPTEDVDVSLVSITSVARTAHLSLEVPEVVAAGQPSEDYPFPWAVVRWIRGEDALTEGVEPVRETAVTLGQLVAELRSIDTTDAPKPGSEGFVRGLPLVGRDATFRSALAHCEDLLDVQQVQAVWEDSPRQTGMGLRSGS